MYVPFILTDYFSYLMLLTSTISVAEVGEPPDISQANTVANTGEKKFIFAAPLFSGRQSGRSWCSGWKLMLSLGLGYRAAGITRRHNPVLLCWTLPRRSFKVMITDQTQPFYRSTHFLSFNNYFRRYKSEQQVIL